MSSASGGGLEAGPGGGPRVVQTGGFVPAEKPRVLSASACLGCGYALEGLGAGARACPECGRPIDEGVTSDPIGGVPAVEAARGASGAGLALWGLLLVVVLPVAGAIVEGMGWWRLTAGPGRGRRSAPWLRGAVRAFVVAAAVAQVAAWAAVLDVYFLKIAVTNTVADDVVVAAVVSVAVGVWTVRQGLGCWWLGRFGRRVPAPELVGLSVVCGLGVLFITVSGFVLIVLGVLVSHIALFPPLCFLLPVWVGAVAVWWLVMAVLLTRVRRALLAVAVA